MDSFRLEPRIGGCAIWINDKALRRWLEPKERRVKATSPGDYLWLPPQVALLPSRHLLGEPAPSDGEWAEEWHEGWGTHKIAVGGCECGSVGCRPLLVTIELDRGTVMWRDFISNDVKDYGLSFTFARGQYEHELREREAA